VGPKERYEIPRNAFSNLDRFLRSDRQPKRTSRYKDTRTRTLTDTQANQTHTQRGSCARMCVCMFDDVGSCCCCFCSVGLLNEKCCCKHLTPQAKLKWSWPSHRLENRDTRTDPRYKHRCRCERTSRCGYSEVYLKAKNSHRFLYTVSHKSIRFMAYKQVQSFFNIKVTLIILSISWVLTHI